MFYPYLVLFGYNCYWIDFLGLLGATTYTLGFGVPLQAPTPRVVPLAPTLSLLAPPPTPGFVLVAASNNVQPNLETDPKYYYY